jgi:TolA-binding protein
MEGDYETAARLYERLLVERHSESDLVDIKRPLVHYKVIYAHFLNQDFDRVEESAESFLTSYGTHAKSIEVRYLLAKSYIKKGRRTEALDQFKDIIKRQPELESENKEEWVLVQVQIGMEIADLMLEEGDRTNAVQVHERLLELELQDNELLDVLYKLGMLHEELKQNQKALAFYQRILDRISGLENGSLGDLSRFLTTMKEMAGWRIEVLKWLETKQSELQSAESSAQVSG